MVHTPRDEQPERGYPGAGQWRKPTDYEDELRPRREAYARIVADRHPPALVAADLGVPESTVMRWVEEERATRSVGRDRPRDPGETEAERREQVRQALFARKQSTAVTKHEQRLVANLKSGLAMKQAVADEVQRDKRVSVATLSHPACRAALAMLEHDGEVVTMGSNADLSLSARWVPPAEREAVRQQRRVAGQADAQQWSAKKAARASKSPTESAEK